MIIVDVHTPFFLTLSQRIFYFQVSRYQEIDSPCIRYHLLYKPHLAEVERASSLTHRFLKVSVVTLHPGGLLADVFFRKSMVFKSDSFTGVYTLSSGVLSEPPSQMAVSASLRPLQSCEEY